MVDYHTSYDEDSDRAVEVFKMRERCATYEYAAKPFEIGEPHKSL